MSAEQASPDAPAGPQPTPVSDEAVTEPAAAGASAIAGLEQVRAERPEVAVGAAFAGGLVMALILKRLAR